MYMGRLVTQGKLKQERAQRKCRLPDPTFMLLLRALQASMPPGIEYIQDALR